MAREKAQAGRVAIVTVHGTNDSAPSLEGAKWFQRGSPFTEGLKQKLAAQGVEADIQPYLWTGANSAKAREAAALQLSKSIERHTRDYDGVHIIGHSHGGNVADAAACLLEWKRPPLWWSPVSLFRAIMDLRNARIGSITTVGTPFFKSRISRAESFGGAAFLFMTVVNAFLIAIASIIAIANQITFNTITTTLANYRLDGRLSPEEAFIWALVALLASLVALFFIMPLAWRGVRRIRLAALRQNENARFYSIWHEHDEAISFLQKVETLNIEPFPSGAILRGSRGGGVLWGVRSVVWLAVGAALVAGVGLAAFVINELTPAFAVPRTWWAFALALTGLVFLIGIVISAMASEEWRASTALWFAGFAWASVLLMLAGRAGETAPQLWLAPDFTIAFSVAGVLLCAAAFIATPLIFGAVFLLWRVIIGTTGEYAFRGSLNGLVSGALRGMAFGRDGDESLGSVATCSHTHGSVCEELKGDGALPARMRDGATQAANALIEKYRWALFTVGNDTNAALANLATDAMTWNSLIHTTYFDQPEVIDLIATHIGREATAPIPAGQQQTLQRLAGIMRPFSAAARA